MKKIRAEWRRDFSATVQVHGAAHLEDTIRLCIMRMLNPPERNSEYWADVVFYWRVMLRCKQWRKHA